MNTTRTVSACLLTISLIGLTSCGAVRRADRREDRRDYIENRIDESYNRGPLDRMEDRRDRREDRWDRRGF